MEKNLTKKIIGSCRINFWRVSPELNLMPANGNYKTKQKKYMNKH